jgi:hypothetical protein
MIFWTHFIGLAGQQKCTFCHMILKNTLDVQPGIKQNVDALSHDFWTHLL